ncbi:hypothetical protein JO375_00845 [Paenibacillus sp. UY79]|nr:hypothetical protein [Paenibacillus farraposensis]MCC3378180.1 hypothetical protein [Paenibacillus farraposensis]
MHKAFERIHRSNLALMGILPLQFKDGENADTIGLTGREHYDIHINDHIQPRQIVRVEVTDDNGKRNRV